MKVKICGLMREQDVKLCGDLLVDIAGFVTEYPINVPWNLSCDEAKYLIDKVYPPMKSCVVTGGECSKILNIVKSLRPDYVQLHFREKISDVYYIAQKLLPLKTGVIKAFPLSKQERIYQFGTENISECVRLLNMSGACAVLVDSRTHDNASQKSLPVDFEIYREIKHESRIPVILAGGITPYNIEKIVKEEKPYAVDIMTGVESSAGIKDVDKLRTVVCFK